MSFPDFFKIGLRKIKYWLSSQEPVTSQPSNANFKRAQELNTALYREINGIPKEELDQFREQVGFYCKKLNFTAEYTEAWMSHIHRLYLTLDWLRDLVAKKGNKCVVVETGEVSIVTHLFREYFPDVDWRMTKGDLRTDWGLPEQTADIILCTEVIEHISDPPEGFQDSFTMAGLKSFLKLSNQTLKPGGTLFITTPNSTSIYHLKLILAGYTPWFLSQHLREYTTRELVPMLKQAGFSIEQVETIHCLTTWTGEDYTPIFYALLEHQFETRDRGDDIFIVAQKNSG